jgi:hypothetical protein
MGTPGLRAFRLDIGSILKHREKSMYKSHGLWYTDIMMMNGENIMNIQQIRDALEMMESNHKMALDFEAHGLAVALRDKVGVLREQLIQAIIAEDPYTTEADIRFFEGW